MTSALPAADAAGTGALAPLLLFLLPLLLLAWLWLSTRRRQRQAEAVNQALQPGQRVLTTSGLVGTLVEREGGFARLEVAPGVILTYDERALLGEAPSNTQPTGGASAADPTAPPKEAR